MKCSSIFGIRCAIGLAAGIAITGMIVVLTQIGATPGDTSHGKQQLVAYDVAESSKPMHVASLAPPSPRPTPTATISPTATVTPIPSPSVSPSASATPPPPRWAGEPCVQGATAKVLRPEAGNEDDTNRNQLRLLEAIRDAGAKAGPNSTFLDVGANIGNFAAHIVKVWPGSRYFLFEIMPHLSSILGSKMLELKVPRDRFDVIRAAVGDVQGQTVPILGNSGMGSDWTGASLVERERSGNRKFDEVLGQTKTITLSNWTASGGPHSMGMYADVPFMKVDTEGLDGKVFRGMTMPPFDLLGSGKVKSIFFELNKMSKMTDMHPAKQFQLLRSKGYDTYLFTTKRLVRINGECFSHDDYKNANFYTRNAIALPRHSMFSCCVLSLYDGKKRDCDCSSPQSA